MLTVIQTEWAQWLEKFGWPTAILFIVLATVGAVARKWAWPLFREYIDRANKKADAADDVLRETLKQAQAREARAEERIDRADQMRETVLRDISHAMQEQARLLKDIREDVRPK